MQTTHGKGVVLWVHFQTRGFALVGVCGREDRASTCETVNNFVARANTALEQVLVQGDRFLRSVRHVFIASGGDYIRVDMGYRFLALDRVEQDFVLAARALVRQWNATGVDLVVDQRGAEHVPASGFHVAFEFVEAVNVAEDVSMGLRLGDDES